MEISLKFIWNCSEIPIEVNLKSIEIQLKFQCNTIGNSLEIPLKFIWNFREIPMEIHWKSSWYFNKIKVKISMKYQLKSIRNLKFWWNNNGNPLENQLKFKSNTNKNSFENQLKFKRSYKEIQMGFHKKSGCFFLWNTDGKRLEIQLKF